MLSFHLQLALVTMLVARVRGTCPVVAGQAEEPSSLNLTGLRLFHDPVLDPEIAAGGWLPFSLFHKKKNIYSPSRQSTERARRWIGQRWPSERGEGRRGGVVLRQLRLDLIHFQHRVQNSFAHHQRKPGYENPWRHDMYSFPSSMQSKRCSDNRQQSLYYIYIIYILKTT